MPVFAYTNGASIVVTHINQPSFGVLSGNGSFVGAQASDVISYAPLSPTFYGNDSFTVFVQDAYANTADVMVTLSVQQPPPPPPPSPPPLPPRPPPPSPPPAKKEG